MDKLSIVIDGKLADCCAGRDPDIELSRLSDLVYPFRNPVIALFLNLTHDNICENLTGI